MSKRKKIDMSKLCLKSSTGVPQQISNFFKIPSNNEPSTSSSTAISRPLSTSSVNFQQPEATVQNVVDTLKAYEHTKDKINRITKRKSNESLPPPPVAKFFDSTTNTSLADFEDEPVRKKPTVKKTKPKRAPSNRSKENNIKKLLQKNKTDEHLFSELLIEQCANENVHPDELQMALALSRSLIESFNKEQTSQTDPTVNDQTTPESRFCDIQKTLENFGFKAGSSRYTAGDLKTVLRVNKNYKWRRKFSKRNLDYIRKSFDEKLEIIFNDVVASPEDNDDFLDYTVSSRVLQELRIRPENTFFKLQSTDVHSSKLMDKYYSGNLFEISTVPSDFLLKNWDEIPGRTPSPERCVNFNLSVITELSQDSAKRLEFPEFEQEEDSEVAVVHKQKSESDVPVLSRTCSRDVESPDLFSESESEEPENARDASISVSNEICKVADSADQIEHGNDSDAAKSGIAHFETYTSDEAKIKDIAPKLCDSIIDIFADVSVDLIDLTSEAGSETEDKIISIPLVLTELDDDQTLTERGNKHLSQHDPVFTLSSETCTSDQCSVPNDLEAAEMPSKLNEQNLLDQITTCNLNNIKEIEDHQASENLNTEDISLVYSDDETDVPNDSKIGQVNDESASILVLSDDSSDGEKSFLNNPNELSKNVPPENSIVDINYIELPHFNDNTLSEIVDDSNQLLPPVFEQNEMTSFACEGARKTTQLTEEDTLSSDGTCTNELEVMGHNLTPSSTNGTQNITLVFSDDEDVENPAIKSISLVSDDSDNDEKSIEDLQTTQPNGLKTPPHNHNSVISLNLMELPNFNNHSEFLENYLTQNISDSIDISDDEVNYSMAQMNPVTPTKTPIKSTASENSSNLLDKSMHSFLRRYEGSNSTEEVCIIEDDPNENDEVNKSVNEFLFRSRLESTDKIPKVPSSKELFKRYPSEPNFSNRSESKTPKKLCFDKIQNDEIDCLVFGDRIDHNDGLISSGSSPLREIPKSPEPPTTSFGPEDEFEEINCPYNYFQPADEYDIVLNQNTPKLNLNGTINMNETLYEGQKYIYKTRNVTPEPNYQNMDIAALHVELKKFGLKKISRPKAVKLLEYIYNETHPIIQQTDKETTADSVQHQIASSQPAVTATKQLSRSTSDKHDEFATTQVTGTWSGIDFAACDANVDYFKSDNFTLNLINNTEMIYLPSKPRSTKLQYCPLPLHIAFYNLFRSNSKLRKTIFTYQPIELEKIYFYFKSIGVKYEMNDLISFLDRHCITFRTDPKNKEGAGGSKTSTK